MGSRTVRGTVALWAVGLSAVLWHCGQSAIVPLSYVPETTRYRNLDCEVILGHANYVVDILPYVTWILKDVP